MIGCFQPVGRDNICRRIFTQRGALYCFKRNLFLLANLEFLSCTLRPSALHLPPIHYSGIQSFNNKLAMYLINQHHGKWYIEINGFPFNGDKTLFLIVWRSAYSASFSASYHHSSHGPDSRFDSQCLFSNRSRLSSHYSPNHRLNVISDEQCKYGWYFVLMQSDKKLLSRLLINSQ